MNSTRKYINYLYGLYLYTMFHKLFLKLNCKSFQLRFKLSFRFSLNTPGTLTYMGLNNLAYLYIIVC